MIVYVYELVYLDKIFMIKYDINKLGVSIIIQLYQRNGKLPLPKWKHSNYLVTPIYN